MQLIIDTHGVSIRVRGGAFLISGKEGKRSVSPKLIDGIMVMSDCMISSDAIRLAISSGIPMLFFDAMGGASGRIWSAQFDRLPIVRRNQVLFERDRPEAAVWAAGLYRMKAEGQIANIAGYDAHHAGIEKMKALLPDFEGELWRNVPDFEEKIMILEAQVARYYWDALRELLPKGYAFNKRSRQPAEDIFNAALNYLYGMLYNTVEGAVFAAGLDPFLGIVHADEYNKPTLVFDLIEPYRTWIDKMLIDLCRSEQLEARHFDFENTAVRLNKDGKHLLIPAYEALMNGEIFWQEQQASVRNHIFRHIWAFSAVLEKYEPV